MVKVTGVGKGKAKIEVYDKERSKETPQLLTTPKVSQRGGGGGTGIMGD